MEDPRDTHGDDDTTARLRAIAREVPAIDVVAGELLPRRSGAASHGDGSARP